jgi:hypothetical protein
MLAGAETAEVGQGTERRPGSKAFAGVTPEPRHSLLRNKNAYQLKRTRPGSSFFKKGDPVQTALLVLSPKTSLSVRLKHVR